MADLNSIAIVSGIEYKQLPWGDLIYGTKEQLQAMGLGVGKAYPGEPEGPKKTLKVLDARGFDSDITVSWDNERYCASIGFPGRSPPRKPVVQLGGNVVLRKCNNGDEYVGTADALNSVGIVRRDQLPGQPGMRKVSVTLLPDGSAQGGSPTSPTKPRGEGVTLITRRSKNMYSVFVYVSNDEAIRRLEASNRRYLEWETRMSALRRPAPLIALNSKTGETARCTRANLRLVWSRPA